MDKQEPDRQARVPPSRHLRRCLAACRSAPVARPPACPPARPAPPSIALPSIDESCCGVAADGASSFAQLDVLRANRSREKRYTFDHVFNKSVARL